MKDSIVVGKEPVYDKTDKLIGFVTFSVPAKPFDRAMAHGDSVARAGKRKDVVDYLLELQREGCYVGSKQNQLQKQF